jgi:G:T-mismatch repair DNA endonuclease (very short patch repair protein)
MDFVHIGVRMTRDRAVTQMLQSKDWTVIRIGECELKNINLLNEKLCVIISALAE